MTQADDVVDGELRRKMLELPPFFQPSPSSEKVPPYSDPKAMVEYYEKTTLNLGLHSRMMRLHRPWLSRGYDDERFAYSKEQCIRAARAGLRLMCGGENNHVAQFLEKWWYVPLHPFYLVYPLSLFRCDSSLCWRMEADEQDPTLPRICLGHGCYH